MYVGIFGFLRMLTFSVRLSPSLPPSLCACARIVCFGIVCVCVCVCVCVRVCNRMKKMYVRQKDVHVHQMR